MVLEKLKRYLDKPLWVNRIAYYLLIFTLVFSGFAIVLWMFYTLIPDFSIIDNTAFAQYNTTQLREMGFFDNERYLISALVQSLAATIALVITLSLVAVQLAAQSYSARVIDVYKNNPDMWILLSIYIVVIFYGLGLLKVIDVGVAGINMEFTIFAAYFLGFFAFVCLVPYIWNILDSLNLSSIVDKLAHEITKKHVLDTLKNIRNEKTNKKDPVQPIVDIINTGLERNDDETVASGISAINRSINDIFKYSQFKGTEEKEISHFIIQHLENIGIQAANKGNENSSISIILALDDIQKTAIKYELNNAIEETDKVIENMQIKVIENRLETATNVITELKGLEGIEAIKRGSDEDVMAAVEIIGEIGRKVVDKKMEVTADKIIKILRNIGTQALNHEKPFALLWTVGILYGMGLKAIENKSDFTAGKVAKVLGENGVEAAENKQGWLVDQTLKYLKDMGVKAAEKKQEFTAERATEALGKMGEKVEDEEIEIEVAVALTAIGMKAIKNEMDGTLLNMSRALQSVGITALKYNYMKSVSFIIDMLKTVGIKAVENERITTIWNTTEALKEIGKSGTENGIIDVTTKSEEALRLLKEKVEIKPWKEIISLVTEALLEVEQAKNSKSNT